MEIINYERRNSEPIVKKYSIENHIAVKFQDQTQLSIQQELEQYGKNDKESKNVHIVSVKRFKIDQKPEVEQINDDVQQKDQNIINNESKNIQQIHENNDLQFSVFENNISKRKENSSNIQNINDQRKLSNSDRQTTSIVDSDESGLTENVSFSQNSQQNGNSFPLSHMAQIIQIQLQQSKIPNFQLFQSLEILNLLLNAITDLSLLSSFINLFPNLHTLYFTNSQLNFKSGNIVQKITTLHLENSNLMQYTLKNIALTFPMIKTLYINNSRMNQDDILNLKFFKDLEFIDLTGLNQFKLCLVQIIQHNQLSKLKKIRFDCNEQNKYLYFDNNFVQHQFKGTQQIELIQNDKQKPLNIKVCCSQMSQKYKQKININQKELISGVLKRQNEKKLSVVKMIFIQDFQNNQKINVKQKNQNYQYKNIQIKLKTIEKNIQILNGNKVMKKMKHKYIQPICNLQKKRKIKNLFIIYFLMILINNQIQKQKLVLLLKNNQWSILLILIMLIKYYQMEIEVQ